MQESRSSLRVEKRQMCLFFFCGAMGDDAAFVAECATDSQSFFDFRNQNWGFVRQVEKEIVGISRLPTKLYAGWSV